MWKSFSTELPPGTIKFSIEFEAKPVSYLEVLRLWQEDEDFHLFFFGLLVNAPFSAYRWETPPFTPTTAGRAFEFVLIDSPGLARSVDRDAFGEHFTGGSETAVAFYNLGKDAELVVPCLQGPLEIYGHLASFIRGAPESQKHAFWMLVGERMGRRLGEKPVWLSTAGAGVSWLHVRLDDRPKYYGYTPYRSLS